MTIKLFDHPTASTALYTFPSAGNMAAGWSGGMESMGEDLQFRTEMSPRNWSPGGVMTGDSLLGPRSIGITGFMRGPSHAEVQLELNEMKNACYRANHNWETVWLQLTQYSTSPFNQVYRVGGVSQFAVEWITDVAVEVTLQFELTDPFRYSRYETTYGPTQRASTPATWTIDLGDNVAFTQLPILLVTVIGGRLSGMMYRNNAVRRPSYATSGLNMDGFDIRPSYARHTVRIDSEAGTVDLCREDESDRQNIISKVWSGDFPWLEPGENTLYFQFRTANINDTEENVAVKLTAKVRKRYL